MLIKASGITNLTDARYFAAKEADFLGFNLEENTPGYLDPMYMKAIREWVEGPQIVGEFSRASTAYIREAAAFFGLDAVQVQAERYAGALPELTGLSVILAIENKNNNSAMEQLLAAAAPHVAYFRIDFTQFRPNDGAFWQQMAATYPILLHSDASAETLSAWLTAIQPAGISLSGGEEEKVGVKSFDAVEEIFEMLGK